MTGAPTSTPASRRGQQRIPAVFMRGGTSKAIMFHARDLPEDEDERHRIFLAAIGSPDPGRRQLDGLGGGVSSLSKVCVIGPPTRGDADVDYTFVQVPVAGTRPDYSANCGNMSSAIGPFAVEEGIVAAEDGEAIVRIHNTNTGKIIESRFAVAGGAPLVEGDFINPGVAGSGARIQLDFLEPGGAATGLLLPSGRPLDLLEIDGMAVEASLVDATNAVVFVPAQALGLTGYERPDELEAMPEMMARLESLRCAGSVRMGLADDLEAAGLIEGSPKVALVAPPRPYRLLSGEAVEEDAFDIAIRIISMGQAHRAVTLTGAMCAAAAAGIEDTCVAAAALRAGRELLRIGHASGIVPAAADVEASAGGWEVRRSTVFRTARRLMEGTILVPFRSVSGASGSAG